MKLLTKTTLLYLVLTLVLFSTGGAIVYRSLQAIINENISENLEQVRDQVFNHVKKTGNLPPQPVVGSDILLYTPSNHPVVETEKDTVLYNSHEEEALPYHLHIFSVQTKEGWYQVLIGKPAVESEDLIESIANALGIAAGILLVILLLVSWIISKSIWKPFYRSLDMLRRFDVNKKEAMQFSPANTSEFKLLNEEIEKMTGKIIRDYQNLKEFTENASHELQTPLAIIRSKLELMIQSENIPQEQMKMIQEVYESTNRLSKLNQSLLLLAKIENRQFHETQEVDIKMLIEKKLEQFEDMIAFKNIGIEKDLSPLLIRINSQLGDILLSNLIGNAIRHNITGGKILLELKNNSLTLSNSGNTPEVSSEKLFERFQKSSTSAESAGLGLSIVKQICDTYGFNIRHSFNAAIHTIHLSF